MRAVGEPSEIPAADRLEGLIRLELKINVKAHEPVEAIHLIGAVGRRADPAVGEPCHGNRLRVRQNACEQGKQRRYARNRSTAHGAPPEVSRSRAGGAAAVGAAASPPTSGSGRKSTILKPSGFQRRTDGSLEGAA